MSYARSRPSCAKIALTCRLTERKEKMNLNLQAVIEKSLKQADEIVASTSEIRKAFVVGRPNSSQESTVAGTLEAFSVIVTTLTPSGFKPN